MVDTYLTEIYLLSSMDFRSPYLSVTFAFFIFLFMIFKIGKRHKTQNPAPKLPPGLSKLPIIGNMHQMLGPLPHHSLRDLARKHGPLMHLKLGEVSTIIVSSPRIAKEVMKTHDLTFADRAQLLSAKILTYGCTDIAFSPYGNYWRQLRKICTLELLSVRRVESFRYIREEEVFNLICSISAVANTPIDMTDKLFALTNNVVAKTTFGMKCKEQDNLLSLMKEAIKLAAGFNVGELFPSWKFVHAISGTKYTLEQIQRQIDAMFEEIIEEHRRTSPARENHNGVAAREEDFIDVLLRFQEQGGLDFPITSNNIKAIIMDIFVAGTDTSATLMDWVMAELMRNPRVMKEVQTETRMALREKGKVDEKDINQLNYLKSVVKEVLRLHPPAPLLAPRECREECEMSGYEIPPKTRVIVNTWAIGRDPEHWDDPETFKPERFEDSPIDFMGAHFEFIPFGAGRRICPGISFGLANALLPLVQLLYYFNWELPSGLKPEDSDMNEAFGSTVGRRSNLFLVPLPCIPLPVV